MGRFFSDVRTPESVAVDLVGDILPENESALEEARKAACQLAGDALWHGKATAPVAVLVRDESDITVGSVDVVRAVMEALGGIEYGPCARSPDPSYAGRGNLIKLVAIDMPVRPHSGSKGRSDAPPHWAMSSLPPHELKRDPITIGISVPDD
jgi:hypothetical protein